MANDKICDQETMTELFNLKINYELVRNQTIRSKTRESVNSEREKTKRTKEFDDDRDSKIIRVSVGIQTQQDTITS